MELATRGQQEHTNGQHRGQGFLDSEIELDLLGPSVLGDLMEMTRNTVSLALSLSIQDGGPGHGQFCSERRRNASPSPYVGKRTSLHAAWKPILGRNPERIKGRIKNRKRSEGRGDGGRGGRGRRVVAASGHWATLGHFCQDVDKVVQP